MKVELDCKKLRELRKQNCLTQEQLAEMLEISDRHLRNLETACTNPSTAVLCRLSYALDIPMEELITVSWE